MSKGGKYLGGRNKEFCLWYVKYEQIHGSYQLSTSQGYCRGKMKVVCRLNTNLHLNIIKLKMQLDWDLKFCIFSLVNLYSEKSSKLFLQDFILIKFQFLQPIGSKPSGSKMIHKSYKSHLFVVPSSQSDFTAA